MASRGVMRKQNLLSRAPPSIIYMVIRCSSYRLLCFIYFVYFCYSSCLLPPTPALWPCYTACEASGFISDLGVSLKILILLLIFPPPWKTLLLSLIHSSQPFHPFTLYQFPFSCLLSCIFSCHSVPQATSFKQSIKAWSKDLVTLMKFVYI